MGWDFRLLIAALAVTVPLAACASGSSLPALPATHSDESSYRLGPGDKLRVDVLGAEDLSGEYSVSDNGTVSWPLIGEVKAASRTRAQLEQEITRKLAQGYVKNPRVSVTVLTYRPFYIFGEVTKPGNYPYASGMRVLNAIAVGGGYTYRANQNYAVVSRDGHEYRADLTAPIQPDDVIRVPERFF